MLPVFSIWIFMLSIISSRLEGSPSIQQYGTCTDSHSTSPSTQVSASINTDPFSISERNRSNSSARRKILEYANFGTETQFFSKDVNDCESSSSKEFSLDHKIWPRFAARYCKGKSESWTKKQVSNHSTDNGYLSHVCDSETRSDEIFSTRRSCELRLRRRVSIQLRVVIVPLFALGEALRCYVEFVWCSLVM